MAGTTKDSSSDSPAERSRSRLRRTAGANTLRSSPALVSWIDRAVSRLTAETPWTYGDEIPVAARASVPLTTDTRLARSTAQPKAVPDDVRERFVRVGRDYYFPSGAQAFRDHGQKVVTRSENTEVIRAFVQIAVARGWRDITVTGTERFRRDAWRIATIAGLVVRGYRPTEFDKQKFVRELAAAREPREAAEPLVDPPARARSRTAQDTRNTSQGQLDIAKDAEANGRKPHERASDSASSAAGSAAKRERMYSGTLLEHGPAPYEFHPHGEPSYFLRIQTQRGAKVLWGKDLERAVEDVKVQSGDEIHLRRAGRQTVTVKRKERDEEGRVLKEHDVKAHRNQWEISRDNAGMAQRELDDSSREPRAPDSNSYSASRREPETQGALLALKGAQLFADRRIKDSSQRSAFVNAVREELVQVLNRGSAVPAPRLRPRAPEKMHAPVER